ncbi:MAG TPA: hypothetical protein VEV81_03840, partial [Pyrinomonadaceae bacterium]|nr:hypothetical protein [Pyrinomonadaceae bacterium]
MIQKKSICSLLLTLILSTSAFAQKPGAPPLTEEQRKARQELEHKALVLLDDVIKEGDSFKHVENRIQIKAASAYLLWKYDEARARTLFRDVMASFTGLLNDSQNAETPEAAKIFEETKLLRAQVLQMLVACDARLAREFMRATRPQTGADGNTMADVDLQLDVNLAAQIAPTDPKLAVEIAEESLSKGFSYQLTTIVSALRAKDPEAAAKLAGEIMTKLRTEKLAASGDARQVAVSLLRLATEAPEREEKGGKNIAPLLEQSSVRELTEMVVAEALRGGGNEDLLMSLQSMMPVVEKYAPARAAQLKQKIPQPAPNEEKEETATFEAVD